MHKELKITSFKIMALVLLLTFFYSCSKYSYKKLDNDNPIFVIHFQDFFIEDTISFNINGCQVLSNANIESNLSLGFAEITLKGYNKGGAMLFLIRNLRNRKKQLCGDVTDILTLHLVLNDRVTDEMIDLKEGMFIGINKGGKDNRIKIRQSAKRFTYE